MEGTQWALVNDDGVVCRGPYTTPPTRDPDPAFSISLLMFVGVKDSTHLQPFLTYGHESAYGEATKDATGFRFAISGKKLEDVLNVRDRFLKKIGVNHNLNPTITLPDGLIEPLSRIRFLIKWIFTGQQ